MNEIKINGWKALAILLFIVVIIESLIIGWIFKVGFEVIEEEENAIIRENKCIIDVCSSTIYDAYNFDDETRICECYTNGVVKKQQIVE